MTAGENGAFWTKPRAHLDDISEIYYARADTGAVLRLGRLDANETLGWSVEWQGRLYWIVFGRPLEPDRLMAADLNGTNLRTVVSLAKDHKGALLAIAALPGA